MCAGGDFVGDMASVMLEGEVTDAKSKHVLVEESRPHIPRQLRSRPHVLRCRPVETAGIRNRVFGSLAREAPPGGEVEISGVGSPWVGDGHGVNAKVLGGTVGCLHCEVLGTCCARCAVRLVHATLAPLAARTSLPKRGA